MSIYKGFIESGEIGIALEMFRPVAHGNFAFFYRKLYNLTSKSLQLHRFKGCVYMCAFEMFAEQIHLKQQDHVLLRSSVPL